MVLWHGSNFIAGPGRGITPAEAARHAGVSWPVAHEAFAAALIRSTKGYSATREAR